MKHKPKSRNPIAKAVRNIRPKVVPDKRRKLLEQEAKTINHQSKEREVT